MPPQDAAAFVTQALAQGPWRHRVRVRVHTSGDLIRHLVGPTVADIVDDGEDCIVALGTDNLDWAARWLLHQDLDFDVLEPPELTDRLNALGHWLTQRYPPEPTTSNQPDDVEPRPAPSAPTNTCRDRGTSH